MFRSLFVFFALCLTALSVNSVTHSQEQFAYENFKRASLADWVRTQNKVLSQEKSIKIIDAVQFYSEQHELDPLLIMGMIKAESTYKPRARSSYGAVGLMQVVPRWHQDKINKRDPYAISVNIEVGTKIISDCLEKTKNNITTGLICYSGGAGSHYRKKIAATHKELNEHLRVLRILNNQRQSYTYSFNNPRIKHSGRDRLNEFIQAKL